MKVLWVLMLAGCLDEPAAPPGHGYEMRDAVVVTDLDGDGFDDLVLWGHDSDPRTGSDLFIRWGGHVPLSATPDVTVHLSPAFGGSYHEVTAVSFTRAVSPPELLALTGDDSGDPPTGYSSRANGVWAITVTGRTVGSPVMTLPNEVQSYGLGGYTQAPDVAYVAGYQPASGAPRVAEGSENLLVDGPLGSAAVDVTSSAGLAAGEQIRDLIAAPGTGSNLVLITTKRAALLDAPPFAATTSQALANEGSQVSRARVMPGLAIATVVPGNSDISLLDIDLSSATLTYHHATAVNGIRPSVVMPATFDYTGGVRGLVTIDPSGLGVYTGLVTTADPVTFAATKTGIAFDTATVMAVGHFAGTGDAIMLFDPTNRTKAPLCYTVDAQTAMTTGC